MRHLIATALLCLFCGHTSAESGVASIYGNGDGEEWTKTASGERMDPRELTAAHKTLPFGTRVLVTNRSNGYRVTVRINDRGPFKRGRIIDVSPRAARELGFCCDDIAPVTVERVP